MTRRLANCPSCGAEIAFRWSGAVQTTCPHCRSILVRHDVDLEKVGTVSDPPPITSRIQIGTEGRYRGASFTVVGRIAYRWLRGGWSEWHVVFDDGRSGWLSDAQEEYAVTFQVPDPGSLPSAKKLRPGKPFHHAGVSYEVASVTRARYAGVEGELPFEYWDHEEVPFADLKSHEGGFATIDFSDRPPILFTGEYVELDSLQLSGLRGEVEAKLDAVRALACPNCAGSVTIRHTELAVTVVCQYCASILDATTPEVRIVQRADGPPEIEPLIPLGSKGVLHGHEYEVLGFQVRRIRVEGVSYSWREYLLFNQERGYRYLSEYDGHWNDIVPLRGVPKVHRKKRPVARLYGEKFKHFQRATAKTTHVLGEFPWEVRRGDQVQVDDYVSPPRMLSSETTAEERTWSLGEYTAPSRIWKAFGLDGAPPRPKGVYANQPAPVGTGRAMATFAVLALALAAVFAVRLSLPHSEQVLMQRYRYRPTMGDTAAVVVGPFTLGGRPSNLEVEIDTDLSNAWAYFTLSLLNVDTGETVTFGREVSYYFGRDADGAWTEGSERESPRIPSVPPGEYMLRIFPEGPTATEYLVTLRRDVPMGGHFLFALLAIAAPAVWRGLRRGAFESRRWSESDYGGD